VGESLRSRADLRRLPRRGRDWLRQAHLPAARESDRRSSRGPRGPPHVSTKLTPISLVAASPCKSRGSMVLLKSALRWLHQAANWQLKRRRVALAAISVSVRVHNHSLRRASSGHPISPFTTANPRRSDVSDTLARRASRSRSFSCRLGARPRCNSRFHHHTEARHLQEMPSLIPLRFPVDSRI
jgi:hypothetical protein